jgi:hypothetical protein
LSKHGARIFAQYTAEFTVPQKMKGTIILAAIINTSYSDFTVMQWHLMYNKEPPAG